MGRRRAGRTGVLNAIAVAAGGLLLFGLVPALRVNTAHAFQEGPRIDPTLVQRTQAAGLSRVIVGHRRSWRPEATLSGPAQVDQRQAIAASQERVRDVVRGSGARHLRDFRHIPFQVMEVTPEALERLRTSDLISSIEIDKVVPPTLASSVPVIDADDAWTAGYTGSGVAVAILDTGVETGHSFLGGRVVNSQCFSTTYSPFSSTSLCPGGSDEQSGTGAAEPSVCSGISGCDHGTHVAGIAAGSSYSGVTYSGVAKGASIIAVQVFSKFSDSTTCGGTAPCVLSYDSDQIAGLEHVYSLRNTYTIASVNMSLGGGKYTTDSACDAANISMKAAIDTLRAVNIATIIASGNDGYTDGISSPGCISTAIAVASTTDADALSSFSNYTSMVELLAPGSSITSSITSGSTGSKSGTSMATPHVAGAWAVLKQKRPGGTVTEILSAFTSNGQSVTSNSVTKPRIKVLAALNSISGVAPSISTHPSSQTIASGSTATLSVVVSSSATLPLSYQWYTGTSGTTTSPISGATSSSYTTSALSTTTSYWVKVTNTIGTANSNTATVSVKPAITTHPSSQTIASGITATLSVVASGTATLSYQWYTGTSGTTTSPISLATSSSYTTPALSTTTSYWVRVTNSAGTADSNTATVSVKPVITTHPSSQTIASGSTATLSVIASGTATLSYQWYTGTSGTTTSPISGATSSSYTTAALSTTTSYWVRVTNSAGTADSNTATVSVKPAITTHPAGYTIYSGQTGTMSVTATGTPTLTYQWYRGTSGTTTNPVSGETSSTITTSALSTTTSYWVRVTNSAGTADSNTATMNVKPAISTHPSSQTIVSGNTATLSVVASGTATLTYQWYTGTSGTTTNPISGATSTSYTTDALSSTATYWVRVTNTHGTADSNTATISVGPAITTHPTSQTIASGSTATLSVAATGTATLTYQWYTGASGTTTSPISGATSSSYTTPALSATTSVWVRVTNGAGTADSNTATISVKPAITTHPASQTVASGSTATLSVVASGPATLSYQWYTGTSGTTTNPIGSATSSTYTTPALSSDTSYWVRVTNSAGTADSNTATVSVKPLITSHPASQTIASGSTATFSVVATGPATLTYQWYTGTSGTTTSPISGATSSSYTTVALSTTTTYWVRVTNSAGTADSNTATVSVRPSITTHPASQTVASGSTATLSVVASGTATLSYQWYTGTSGTTTSPISGATSSSYTTTSLSSDASYWVRVTNSAGTADSNTATVSVKPAITTQPSSQTIASGSTATFSVVAAGPATLSYQWYTGTSGTTTSPISGATSSSYTTVALSTTTSYWVRVTNSAGTADSNTATASVKPAITTHPANQTIASGSTATLSVVASGTATLSYQWYTGTSGTTTSPISGATSSSYTTAALSTTTSYWVRVTNAAGTADSNAATVSVKPSITTQPASQTVASGGTATLAVVASGTATLSYQWYSGTSGTTTSPIAGATSSTYTTAALSSDTSYWVRVTNSEGTSDSNTATVSVKPAITTHPASQAVTSGSTATLSVTASGPGTLTYQWYVGGSGTTTNPIAGATSSSYTTAALSSATSYWVRVTNANGTADSNTAAVTIATAPTISTHPSSTTIASGASATLTVAATGTVTLTYQWYTGQSGTTTNPISGATSSSYTTAALSSTTGYWVRVTNSYGAANSNTATVTVAAAPTISAGTSATVTGTTATLGGTVASDGGSTITERGVVYSKTATNPNPLIGGSSVTKSTVSGTTGLFTSDVTGLLPSTGYSFKAYATNAVGTSYTTVATFTTTATVPDAPTIGTATAGDTTVSVTFTAPLNNGGSAVTGYTATCSTKSASGSASPITVTGLTNGTAVTCTVLATNAVGDSVASAASNSVTPTAGSGISRTVCASGCGFTRIQDAINASAPGDRVLVKSTYDSISSGEVFPIQTTAIKGQNPAGTVTIAGETDQNGNPATKIKIRNVTGLDGIMMVSPGVISNLKIVPGDGTRPNRVIAAGSGDTCPGSTCHLKGGLTIQNVVIDFTVIDGTTTAHFNTGNGVDLLADDVLIDKVTIKGIAGNSILVDGDNYTIQNSTLDGRDPSNGNAIRGALAIGFGADQKLGGVACSGFPTNYVISGNAVVGYQNGIRWCSGRNTTVSNNTITDVSGKGIDTTGSQGTQIFGNILQQNTTAAIYGIGLSTNAFQTCTGNTVRNNKVLGRAARDTQRGIVVLSCLETTIFQNEVRDFADVANGGAIYASMTAGVATKTTIQGNTVIGGDGPGIVYIGADSGATAVDQSVIRDNVVNEFKRNGIIVQRIKGVRSGAGAGNVVAYNTVRAVNLGSYPDTHAFNLQNLANTAFDRNTALDTRGAGTGFYLADSTGVNGNCNTGSTNGGGLFAQVNVTPVYGNANVNCRVALYSRYDFDNDGRSDVTMYRHTTGEWFTRNSSNGADTVTAFGAPGSDDIPAPGNYTAVGRTDRAIYRYTTGEWYIRRATDGGTTVITFGSPLVGDVPMPADYDGDGLTDLAVFRTSTANAEWYIRLSSTGATQYVAWGCAACADLGVPGDYDGDGKADVAVYRRSTGDWFIRKSTDTALQQVPFGDSAQGDIPVPGRYTQASKTDMAVYRSLTGEWFIRRSTDFGITSVQFGTPSAGDFPVSANFTQSGITDIAIYRPTPPTAQFMIRKSTDFSTLIIPYGNPGSQDAPLTAR